MSDAKEGEEMAKAWLRGEGELIDDLADLVAGMDRPLDGTARAFLQTIGNAAKASSKSKVRQTPAGAPTPARLEQTAAQPSPEPPQPRVDLNELMRRRAARERARLLEQFGRSNQQAWAEQGAMIDATRRF
jgi:hypothetical protein